MIQEPISDRNRIFTGVVCIASGLIPMAIGSGLLAVNPATIHAPMAVIFGCGLVFVIAGMMLMLQLSPRFNNMFAALLLGIMGCIGGWVSLFGEAAQFSGGLMLLPDSANLSLARMTFGFGALILFAMCAYAVLLARRAGR